MAGLAPVAALMLQGRRLGWHVLNDTVMGGKSSSSVTSSSAAFSALVTSSNEAAAGGLLFEGSINLDGGGFASCRSEVESGWGLSGEGFKLVIKGDGNTYKMTLQTPACQRGMSYQQDFATKAGTIQSIELPISAFGLQSRGQTVESPPPAMSTVHGIGFMLSLKTMGGAPNPTIKNGPFKLEVLDVATVSQVVGTQV